MSCSRIVPDALPYGETVERSAHLELVPDPRVVAQARRFVVEHAPPLSQETLGVLVLLVSELVTNAVIHAGTALEVAMVVASGHVLVSVSDEGGDPEPQQRDREGGRGLHLVRTLADRADLRVHSTGGKTAWFRLERDA